MNIAVLFTYGVSLKQWHEAGILIREAKIYNELTKKNVNVDFITFGDDTDYQYQQYIDDITIHPVYANIKYSKSKVIRFLKSMYIPFLYAKTFKNIDIIKTNQMWGSWIALIASALWSKKLLIRCGYEAYKNAQEENVYSKSHLFFLRFISSISYRYATSILVSSKEISDYIVNEYGIKQNKVKYLWNYVDTDKFYNLEQRIFDKRVLFVGRLAAIKNIFSLIDAVKGTEYGVDIIGDGDLKDILKKYSRQNQVDVRFLGTVSHDELPVVINKYNLYILCSYHEGSPKALLEAMSCGLAVIGTDVPGIREVIEHNKTGIICGTDFLSIRKAILDLGNDKTLQHKLGLLASKSIIDNCSLLKYVSKEIDLMEYMIEKH